METGGRKLIWLIDHHEPWRHFSEMALKKAGYRVWSFSDYHYPPRGFSSQRDGPDLIIVGNGETQRDFVERLVRAGHHVVVLAALPFSHPEMRCMFRVGAEDVVQKPYDPSSLLDIVKSNLENIERASSYRIARMEAVE